MGLTYPTCEDEIRAYAMRIHTLSAAAHAGAPVGAAFVMDLAKRVAALDDEDGDDSVGIVLSPGSVHHDPVMVRRGRTVGVGIDLARWASRDGLRSATASRMRRRVEGRVAKLRAERAIPGCVLVVERGVVRFWPANVVDVDPITSVLVALSCRSVTEDVVIVFPTED